MPPSRALLDDISLEPVDAAIDAAFRDDRELPILRLQLELLRQTLQSARLRDIRAGMGAVETGPERLARVLSTIESATRLVEFYERRERSATPSHRPEVPPVAPARAPAPPPATARPAAIAHVSLQTPVSDAILSMTDKARDTDPHPKGAPARLAATVAPETPPTPTVAYSPAGRSEPAIDHGRDRAEPTPGGETVEPLRLEPGLKEIVRATALSDLDWADVRRSLCAGPARDGRSFYTLGGRERSSSIERLLETQFQVDPAATPAIIRDLQAMGLVTIERRGLPPRGEVRACILVAGDLAMDGKSVRRPTGDVVTDSTRVRNPMVERRDDQVRRDTRTSAA